MSTSVLGTPQFMAAITFQSRIRIRFWGLSLRPSDLVYLFVELLLISSERIVTTQLCMSKNIPKDIPDLNDTTNER